MKKIIQQKISTLLLILLSCINVFGQESWDFGDKYKAYVQTASAPLKIKMHSRTSLKSGRFVSKVGGVAFLQVAEPDESLKGVNIKYSYISKNQDGSRLRIIAGKDTLFPYLPDWQLIPIVKFAHSEYNSCVSLFGPQNDSTAFDITYHPAFQNTLLGIRLLQADMALMDISTFWQLPTNNGKKILGLGEKEPDKYTAISTGRTIHINKSLGNHQSWVFTDDNINVKFSIVDNKMQFTGYPYYYFWRIDKNEASAYYTKIRLLYIEYNNLTKDHNSKVKIYNISQSASIEREISILREKIKNKESEISQIDYEAICDEVATGLLKDKYSLFLEFNEPVYSASLNVVHYSAFFRYLKKSNSVTWIQFYNKVSSVHTSPIVNTPTVFPKNKINE